MANNVFAHVPDIVDFAKGLRALVADGGSVSIEIPHLLRLIEGNEYDTIYHEHFSYLSLLTTQRVLADAGLTVVDVEELPSHGGSLRTWSMPADSAMEPTTAVGTVLAAERAAGLHTASGHEGFAHQVAGVRNDFVQFLLDKAAAGALVGRLRCPGQGKHASQSLWRPCRPDGIHRRPEPFQARQVPAGHTHSHPPVEELTLRKPDYIVIMPWNLRKEITAQLEYTREWGARLVVALPKLEIF